jgi:hypothetical protein
VTVRQNTRIVKKGSKITTGHVLHGKIDTLVILERVQQPNQPLALGCGQDVPFRKNVPDFIQLEQQLLAHDLQSTHLPGILLLCKEDLPITSLANLRQDLEISLAKSDTPLSKIGPFSSSILLPQLIVCCLICFRRRRYLRFEGCKPTLP